MIERAPEDAAMPLFNRGRARLANADCSGDRADFEAALRRASPGWTMRAEVERRLRELAGDGSDRRL